MNKSNLWYKDAVFYELYVRAFRDSNGDGHGDLNGAKQKLDYLQDLGVTCIWLLPIYPSPLEDDGYDIADFYGVHPDYGTIDDFKAFVDEAHQRGMRVIADLVLNHTSDQHPWFEASRKDRNSPYRDYYVWSDTKEKYKDARIIFLDTEESNWTWDDTAGQYFWHRFYSSQPDLNYENSAVREEMKNVMRFWLNLGIDGFRADAVPYLFERDGTNCENLSETHEYLKELRRTMDDEYPGRILLCEANQWPEDVRRYFGNGDEFHMGFHFPVMPRIFMALRREKKSPLVWIMDRTPPIPDSNQWCIFLRNHDELTLEMVTPQEREWMWEQYAQEPRMRLNLGIRRRLAPLLENDRKKIELANSLLFTLPGSPILYYGDEIGMGDNIWLPDRNGVRTPMQWESGQTAGFSDGDIDKFYSPIISAPEYAPDRVNVASQSADPDSLFNQLKKMISIRMSHKVFGWGDFQWIETGSEAVAAYLRTLRDEKMLVISNLSGSPESICIDCSSFAGVHPVDILRDEEFQEYNDKRIIMRMEPHQYFWLNI